MRKRNFLKNPVLKKRKTKTITENQISSLSQFYLRDIPLVDCKHKINLHRLNFVTKKQMNIKKEQPVEKGLI